MATTQQYHQSPQRTDAKTLLNNLWSDPAICPWCFRKIRRYYTEYEESVAEHLAGRNNTQLEARGHRVTEDGTLLVDSTATSGPDPDTFFDVVPGTTIDGKHYLPRAQSVCKCGVVDYEPDDDRPKRVLFEAVENIYDHLSDEHELSKQAMIAMVRTHINQRSGQDKDVFRDAIAFGRKKA